MITKSDIKRYVSSLRSVGGYSASLEANLKWLVNQINHKGLTEIDGILLFDGHNINSAAIAVRSRIANNITASGFQYRKDWGIYALSGGGTTINFGFTAAQAGYRRNDFFMAVDLKGPNTSSTTNLFGALSTVTGDPGLFCNGLNNATSFFQRDGGLFPFQAVSNNGGTVCTTEGFWIDNRYTAETNLWVDGIKVSFGAPGTSAIMAGSSNLGLAAAGVSAVNVELYSVVFWGRGLSDQKCRDLFEIRNGLEIRRKRTIPNRFWTKNFFIGEGDSITFQYGPGGIQITNGWFKQLVALKSWNYTNKAVLNLGISGKALGPVSQSSPQTWLYDKTTKTQASMRDRYNLEEVTRSCKGRVDVFCLMGTNDAGGTGNRTGAQIKADMDTNKALWESWGANFYTATLWEYTAYNFTNKVNYGLYTITPTFTNGTANITLKSHGFSANQQITFTYVPSPLTVNTIYFVKDIIDVDTFTVAATAGGAAISMTASLSGLTFTNASENITLPAHGLSVGKEVIFSNPASPLVGGTTYYVVTVVDANNFKVSATPGGTAITMAATTTGTTIKVPGAIRDFNALLLADANYTGKVVRLDTLANAQTPWLGTYFVDGGHPSNTLGTDIAAAVDAVIPD